MRGALRGMKYPRRAGRVGLEAPAIDVLEPVEVQREDGESIFEAFERLAIQQALWMERGSQAAAAERLGVSTRSMNYRCARYGMRPMDRDAV